MRVAVLQSSYFPWKGYFDIASQVDLFIFYDDVQYTKNDWRNRNRVYTQHGLKWLTVPVGQSIHRLIQDVEIIDRKWQKSHWATISQEYRRARGFEFCREFLKDVFLGREWSSLSELNQFCIRSISSEFLRIPVRFDVSSAYALQGSRGDRLLDLLCKVGTTEYLSGPSARTYLDLEKFSDRGISVRFMDYTGYPEYEQCCAPFVHEVSVLDVLLCTGPDAAWYVWKHRGNRSRVGEE